MSTPAKLLRELKEKARGEGLLPEVARPIWPDKFNKVDAETACRFIFDHVSTFLETPPGPCSVPQKAYLERLAEDWHHCFETGQSLQIIKSRRLIVSWFCGALELHAAGVIGGKWWVTASKYDPPAGSTTFVWRAWYMYDQLRRNNPDWRLGESSQTGNTLSQSLRRVVLPNGALVEPVNADGESMRGSGVTCIRGEELSQYADVSGVWAQARTTTQGVAGGKRGFAYAANNASPNPEFHELITEAGKGFWEWDGTPYGSVDLPNGIRRVHIHHTADEEKGSEWAAQEKRGYPVQKWRSEMDLDCRVYEGEPVYPEFHRPRHCPPPYESEDLAIVPGSYWVVGWDCSTATRELAAVMLQVIPEPYLQVQAIREWQNYQGDGGSGFESMEEFAPRVKRDVQALLGGHRWYCVADPAGRAVQGATGKSAFDVARDKAGLFLQPSESSIHLRRSAGFQLLTSVCDGEDDVPRFVISGKGCPVLLEALSGRFRLRVQPRGDASGPGIVTQEPVKDFYSHTAEAWEYAAIDALKVIRAYESGSFPKTKPIKHLRTKRAVRR